MTEHWLNRSVDSLLEFKRMLHTIYSKNLWTQTIHWCFIFISTVALALSSGILLDDRESQMILRYFINVGLILRTGPEIVVCIKAALKAISLKIDP